ncbi:hypothetical protein [Marinifilum sp.]|uniref:hypothetical protein n=1 Tax=Marinifilum sp. TaxID=2033137 RepID=UPI003BABE631
MNEFYLELSLNYAENKNMEIFEMAKGSFSVWDRIRKELSLLVLLLAIIFFFVGLNKVYFASVILMYAFLLMLKRNRIITKLSFNDTKEELCIEYYYFIFIKSKEEIPYSKLSFKLGLKRFGFGSARQTLELFKGKILTAELQKDGKWKWSEEKTNAIFDKLTSIQNIN